jgi:hypothetical protein
MDLLTDLVGLTLVAAGAFGAGFEFRMIRSRFAHLVLMPGAGLFRSYVGLFVWGVVFVSDHWHNSAVTWTLTGLGTALTSVQGAQVMRSRHRRAAGG